MWSVLSVFLQKNIECIPKKGEKTNSEAGFLKKKKNFLFNANMGV